MEGEPLDVLIVHPIFKSGGAERQIHALASRFRRKGHSVTVLTAKIWSRRFLEDLEDQGIEIVETGFDLERAPSLVSTGYLGKLRTIGLLTRYFREHTSFVSNFSVINLHNWPSYLIADKVGLLRKGSPPVVWTCNEPTEFWMDGYSVLGYPLYPMERRAIRSVPTIITLSRYMQNILSQRYQADSRVIPPGIDCKDIGNVGDNRKERDEDSLNILCYVRKVNFPVQVLSHLTKRYPRTLLHMMGPWAMRSHQLARARGLGQHVRLHNWIPEDEYLRYLSGMDVMIFPHVSPFGLSMLEAMSVGVPVVSVAKGGQLDIVEPESNGYLVRDPSPLRFAQTISQHLEDIRSDEMRRRCAEGVCRRFSWDRSADQYLEVFSNVIGASET